MSTRQYLITDTNSIPTGYRLSKAVATLKPEPTQQNSLGRLQIRKQKSATVLLIAASTPEPDPTGVFLPATPDCRPETKPSLFRADSLARYLLQ
jgi:hypothetical protein